MNAIEVENLSKFYGPARGIEEVSFSVKKGEIMGFLGPNGSGKTTTMRILTCFFPPTSGTARICGSDILNDSFSVRQKIGYLPENVPLYMDMPVFAYLNFFAEIKGVPSRMKKKKVDEVIQRCELQSVSHRLIRKLSKGFRQRVGIAQALLNDPEVLILDEPTVGLDPKQIIDIRSLIKGLGGSQTVILSTHILPEVSMTCDRVIIMHQGKLVAVDTPSNLTKKLQQAPKIMLKVEGPVSEIINTISRLSGITTIDRKEPDSEKNGFYEIEIEENVDVINEIAKSVYENNWKLKEIRPVDMTLEEIFIKVVTEEEGVNNK
jgi:ABC-2 type transport system ATP-binding protein